MGSEDSPFYVYKELACQDSGFFKAALNSSFVEGKEQSISFPEDDVAVFKVYLTWLNLKTLRFNFDHEEWWCYLAKLWIFADKICAPKFMNKVVDAFFEVFFDNRDISFASAGAVHYVYEHTSTDSALRRIFVRFFLQMTMKNINLQPYPHDFVVGVVSKILVNEGCRQQIKTAQASIMTKSHSRIYHQQCGNPCCKKKV